MRSIVLLFLMAPVLLAWSVCLDPGHGGSDNGAIGIYYTEKEANLDVAYMARSYLEQLPGCEFVAMTRSSDVYVSLADRVAYANAGGYDRFISMHHNAFNGSVQGTETYCDVNGTPESFAFRDIVHPYVVDAFGYSDRGVKTAGFYVIKYTVMPSILGEASFLDYIAQWNESWRFQTHWADHDGIEGWAYCAGLCENLLSPETPDYLDRVVDNSYPRFSTEGSQRWRIGNYGLPFGPDYAWIFVTDGLDAAKWNPYIPVSGWYDVSLWWVAGSDRATGAKFTIHHHNGESTVYVDQGTGGEEWFSLGTYAFHEGTFGWVSVSSEGSAQGRIIVADAVRFRMLPTGIEGDTAPSAERPILISPNPAPAYVSITLQTSSAITEVDIYDISGRLVQRLLPLEQSGSFLWSTDGCEPGVYFAAAEGEETGFISGRIVILD
jgi:hypothetical protein